MTAHVLISGSLFHQPEQRTSKAGRPFVTAVLKANDGDSSQYWKVLAFSESVQTELLQLSDGDAVSLQGPLKAEIYRRADGGEPRVSRSMIAERILPLRQEPKERADPFSKQERQRGSWSPGAGPNDSLDDIF
jgi:hypothetical protein